jgi:hypothetical protein
MKIVLKNFKGLFTNADREDISEEYLTSCKNFLPKNGRLEKTMEFGASDIAIFGSPPADLRRFAVHVHEEAGAGYNIMAIKCETETHGGRVYGYNFTTDNFVEPDSMEDDWVSHVYGYPKMVPLQIRPISYNNVLRFMPGRTS